MDNITTVTEIDSSSNELVANLMQMFLSQKLVLAPTLTDYTSLVGKGMKSVDVPRAGKLQAQRKGAATKLSAQALTIGADTISLDNHYGVLVDVEDIAAVQANIDVMSMYVERMSAALALEMDNRIYEQMKLTSSSSPDHRVAFAAGSALTKADFTVAKKLLRTQNVPMDDGKLFLAINPYNEKAILDLSDFVDADKWLSGSAEAKLNGVIGRAYGFNIVISNVIDDTANIFYHSSHVAFAKQLNLKLESQRDIDNLSDKMAMSHSYGCKVMDLGVRGVLIGSAS